MNSPAFQQAQRQSQTLTLAPHLQNSLKILQVPAMELRTSILAELQTNPLLEELAIDTISIDDYGDNKADDETAQDEEANFDNDDFSILERMSEDLSERYDAEDPALQYTSEDEKRREHFMNSLTEGVSLQTHLIEQAELNDFPAQEHEALLYLIGSLDDNGFLTESVSEIATTLQVALDIVEKAVSILKGFDPPGIGARDLQDCLATQLELNGQGDSIAARIVRDHFQLLTRRRIPEMAHRLNINIGVVQEAVKEIARLDPAPGRRFKQDTNTVVEPDVTVYKDEYGEWQIELNNNYIPRLRISNAYKEMLARGNLSKQEREFMIERMRSGKFLINSIEQRQQTIASIAKEIIKAQKDFLELGITKLRPMTMESIAQAIDVHETTVSRAVANKFMRTPQGVFPFKYFFTTGYKAEDGEAISNKTVKDRIKQIVANEAETKPLSDQAIVRLLAQENIEIARRTVSKYREELGILPAHMRRRY